MNGIHGILLMATAAIHVLVGLLPFAYQKDWATFSKKKLWNTIAITDDRNMAAFWFVIAGPMLFIGGIAVYELEQNGLLPPSVGWALLGTAVLGGIMSPKSGFTVLLLPQAIFYLATAYG